MLLALPVSAQDFVGKWISVMEIQGMGEMKNQFDITKNEEGEYKLNLGNAGEVKSLTVKEKVMTVVVEAMGYEATMVLELKEADKMTGTLEMMGYFVDVTAERVKEEQQ